MQMNVLKTQDSIVVKYEMNNKLCMFMHGCMYTVYIDGYTMLHRVK